MNIATGTSSAKTINIGTGSQTINTITIGNASSSVAVSGTLRITEGNQGANKFLGSDAGGNATWQAIAGADGWTDAGETWTYASADDPTFTFTVSGDKTSKYSAGMRVKVTQTTVKYFIITAVSYSAPNTTITVYGGTDYDLTNATISANYYSGIKAPQGFPMDPTKWTVELRDVATRTQMSPVTDTWYNLGSLSIVVPIGVWGVDYQVSPYANDNSGAVEVLATLSTANNTESDVDFTSVLSFNATTLSSSQIGPGSVGRNKVLVLAAKTSYYLNEKTPNLALDQLGIIGAAPRGPTIIRAVSTYL